MSRGLSVLHVDSNRAWGGGQNQIRLLMRELARAGVRQLCICPRNSPLAQRLAADGLPVRAPHWTTGSDPRAWWSIASHLRNYAIVHCHDAHALQLAVVPAKLLGTRIVAARRVRFKTSASKWNLADRVIAVSETVRAELIRSGISEARVHVIHSGTDAEETRAVPALQPSARDRYAIPADALVAGNAGALYEVKGQTLIPVAAALLPGVHWLIAGDGPHRPVIEQAIAENGVADRVHLMGWLPDARAMLRELDVYVSTSTNDGLGNSMTEALALGVPIIAADAGGPAEIMRPIHERLNGVLFPPGDAEALAAALTRLRDPAIRDALVAEQNKRFEDFAIERTAAQTLRLYHELMRM